MKGQGKSDIRRCIGQEGAPWRLTAKRQLGGISVTHGRSTRVQTGVIWAAVNEKSKTQCENN